MDLDEIMAPGTVVEVSPDGAVHQRGDMRQPYMEYYGNDSWDLSAGWELLKGHSGQEGYEGPAFHSAEYIGGGLEEHILSHPGFYCVLYHLADLEDETDEEAWFIAFRPA